MIDVQHPPQGPVTSATVQVVDEPGRSRFEAFLDGELVGFADYQRTDELVALTHTEVDPGVEGKGVGGTLVRGALDQIRDEGRRVLPVCPFVQAWVQRHPEYAALDYRSPSGTATD